MSGLVGLGTGYLTLRLRGAFFAIATLALAVVLQTLIVNWDFVGGSRGAYIIRPGEVPILGSYIQYLFLVMLVLSVVALATARIIERSRLGYGFATIRDDELAAEACGVPTLRLKLIATTISGALMGMAGAPFPYYIGYLEPSSAFGLAYAVNSIAMPMIGGTTSWVGPLVGALLLGTIQQIATVTISSAVNLLIVGLLLVGFVIVAPKGIVGLVQDFMRERASDGRRSRPGARGLPFSPTCGRERADGRAAAPGRKSRQALRRLCRAGRHQPVGPAGRARRADRAERLGQVDAGQLHVRHAAERKRHGAFRRPCRGRPRRQRAHPSRHGTELPAAAAVRDAVGGGKPAHSAALHRAHARAAAIFRQTKSRAAAMNWPGLVGLAAKADKLPRDLTQVEMRKLELARAMAADPKLLIADEAMAGLSQSEVDEIVELLIKMNERGVTIILIEHIMRAVMASRSGSWCWCPARRSPTARRRRWSAIPR